MALCADRLNVLSICTGGGGLDRALELAIPNARPIVCVEREAFAIASLVSQIEDGLMAPAAIWSDVRTFDGRPWRGLVDGVIGGIPCQPHSLAGRRGGSDDERDLWSPTRRIIVQARPWFVLIENVAGMLSAGNDEVPGAFRVRRDLRKLGYEVEGGLFRASDVGLPHERERIFILGVADHHGVRCGARIADLPARQSNAEGCGPRLADTRSPRRKGRRPSGDRQGECPAAERGGEFVGDAQGVDDQGKRQSGAIRGASGPGEHRGSSPAMEHAAGVGRREGRPEPELRGGRDAPAGDGGELEHALSRRCDGRQEVPEREPKRRTAQQLPCAIPDGQHLAYGDSPEPPTQRRDVGEVRSLQEGEGRPEHGPALSGGGRAAFMADTDEPEFCGKSPAGRFPELQCHDGTGERPFLRPPGPGDLDAWRAVAECAPRLLPAISRHDLFCHALRAQGLAPDGNPSSGAWVDAQTGERVHPTVIQEATKLAIRGVADVMAPRIDELRLLGNGVADAQGALAIRTLVTDLQSRSASAAELVRMMGPTLLRATPSTSTLTACRSPTTTPPTA